MTLNASQLAAVESTAPITVVMSGPGSGKTRVGVERAVRCVKQGRKVVVLTFTRSGAHEFATRVASAETALNSIHKVTDLQVPFCGTLHSYCLRLVREFGHLIGYGPNRIAIISEADSKDLRDQIKTKFGFNGSKGNSSLAIQTVDDEYRFILKRNNLLDHDGVLVAAEKLLAIREVTEKLIIDDLIIDEGQDSAAIDWAIYGLLPAKSKFVVGDIDQCIFEFRGAFPYGLLNYAKGAEVFTLEENYRCGAAICEAANNLIEHNVSRYAKRTLAATENIGCVTVTGYNGRWQEIQDIVPKLVECLSAKLSVAILCRANHDIDQIKTYLFQLGLPIHMGDVSRVMPPDWRRLQLLVGLAVNPSNEVLAEQYLRLDHENVDQVKLECQAAKKSLLDLVPGFIGYDYTKDSDLLSWLTVNHVSQSTLEQLKKVMAEMPPDAKFPDDLLTELHAQRWESSVPAPEGKIFAGTVHAAKGKEFDVVFLPRFDESAKKQGVTEEERRIAFVAITRARRAVSISWARRAPQWGEVDERKPSQFIQEMKLQSEPI